MRRCVAFNPATQSQCWRRGKFLIDAQFYCRVHAAALALKLLLSGEYGRIREKVD